MPGVPPTRERSLASVRTEGSGLADERSVGPALLRSGERSELLREGEGDEIMIPGEEPLPESGEPRLGTSILALGAVAVATGVVAVLERAAVVAAEERATKGRSATRGDVGDRSPVRGQELPGVGP